MVPVGLRVSQFLSAIWVNYIPAVTVANNISKNAYYYWLRKLRTTAIESASPRFVELPAPKDETVSTQPVNGAPPAHGMIEISLNDAVLKINGSVSRDLLSIVIGVLKDA